MLSFALKSMANRRAKLLMTALSVVITAAVALMAYNISTQVSEGIVNTAAKYDMIIGPSGSATQLAMNTMFFTDKPLGTIPYSLIDELKATGLVNEAIPFSMGDSYNAAPIVGTDAALLADKPLKEGAMFEEALDAVVGAQVAKAYGVRVGDKLVTSHGLNTSGAHGAEHADHPLTVTGILARTYTAYDNAGFTPVSSIRVVHDHEHEDADEAGEASPAPSVVVSSGAGASGAPSHAAPAAEEAHDEEHEEHEEEHEEHDHDEDHDHDHDDHDHDHAEEGQICAVLVRSTGFSAYSQLMSAYGGKAGYLAINPNTVLREVMDNVDLSRRIVYILCGVILVMNLFVVTVIALLNMVDSRREIALMRLIGISMKRINQLYFIQNAIAGAAAMVCSLLAAHLFLLAARGLAARMGIVLSATRVYPMEGAILLVVFVLSILPTAICTSAMAGRDGMDS